VAFEVIVVDNGSRESVAEVCSAFPGVRLVVEPVPGPGPARNRGAALARGEIIAFIDADCVAHQGWADAIESAFREPGVDVVGGDIRILPRSAQRTPLEAYEGLYSYRARLFVERHGYAATGNMAVRAEVFRRVGPFQGLGTHEDVVWGRAARALGCSIVFRPSVTVSTDACDSFEALAKRLDRLVVHSRSDTWPRGQLRWGIRTGLVLASPLVEIARILTSDRLTGARERLAVFALLVRTRLHRARRMALLWHSGSGAELIMSWNRE
jgi:glycosyltransferase involved in cell wall biosynthesis